MRVPMARLKDLVVVVLVLVAVRVRVLVADPSFSDTFC